MSTRKFIRKQKIYRFKVIQLSQRTMQNNERGGIAYDIITTFRTVRRQCRAGGRAAGAAAPGPCVPPAIREEARRLRRRIAELRPMLEQCRRLTQLTARYYDRSFCGYGEYRI